MSRKVKPLSRQGCYQLSTVSIPVHFDHFEALNHHFIDEPREGSLIQALDGYQGRRKKLIRDPMPKTSSRPKSS